MAQVTITINSREYSLACEDGQEARIIKLANILDEKATQIVSATGPINENLLLAMVGILTADELYNKQNEKPSTQKEKIDTSELEKADKDNAAILKSITERINYIVSSIEI